MMHVRTEALAVRRNACVNSFCDNIIRDPRKGSLFTKPRETVTCIRRVMHYLLYVFRRLCGREVRVVVCYDRVEFYIFYYHISD